MCKGGNECLRNLLTVVRCSNSGSKTKTEGGMRERCKIGVGRRLNEENKDK